MEFQEAIDLVSYKLALKSGEAALIDPVLNPEVVNQAIADKAAGTEEKIDLKAYMQATKIVKEERLRLDKETGSKFLAENSSGDGVRTMASGLQYRVLTPTEGTTPALNDTVTVHYEGKLIDGTVFDSSHQRGKEATFKVAKVIDGWKEGLQLMTVGSTYQFFIPENLAYGDRGNGSAVPPFATLIFEVTLLSVGE